VVDQPEKGKNKIKKTTGGEREGGGEVRIRAFIPPPVAEGKRLPRKKGEKEKEILSLPLSSFLLMREGGGRGEEKNARGGKKKEEGVSAHCSFSELVPREKGGNHEEGGKEVLPRLFYPSRGEEKGKKLLKKKGGKKSYEPLSISTIEGGGEKKGFRGGRTA